jgi:Putative DNA-binding domain
VIPKLLNEIEWSDIEALRDSGREEDDTIEYKGSFSGGSDFLAFTDSQRVKAVDGVVREALAFLNGRGGDVVIGVREAKNDHPKIEEITPVANVIATVDRLAQSLAAVIEPTQSILGVKAILNSDGSGDGVIVVRAPSSLRAPHRYTGNKECYIRRGRESVPMPMDEVQDVTLSRAMRQSERLALLERQFESIGYAKTIRTQLPSQRVRIKSVFLPLLSGQVLLDDASISFLGHRKPDMFLQSTKKDYFSVMSLLGHATIPVLRGIMLEGVRQGSDRFVYSAKTLNNNLMMTSDYIDGGRIQNDGVQRIGVYFAWLAGYLASTLLTIRDLIDRYPTFSEGVLRIQVQIAGEQNLIVGSRYDEEIAILPENVWEIPDFEVSGSASIDGIFAQAQKDICGIAGIEWYEQYRLTPAQ